MSEQRKHPWKRDEWVWVGLNVGGQLGEVYGQVYDGTDSALRIHVHRMVSPTLKFGPESDADGRCLDLEAMFFAPNILMVRFLPLPPDWCTCPGDER